MKILNKCIRNLLSDNILNKFLIMKGDNYIEKKKGEAY